MFKKIIGSKWVKLAFSGILLYWAFKKVDVVEVIKGLLGLPWWFLISMVLYSSGMVIGGALRWSLLVLPKVGWNDIWIFTRAIFLGGFYGLFFPSSVAVDAFKWVPLMKKYPKLGKTTLFGSVVLDRVIGLSVFAVSALVSLIIGLIIEFEFPSVLLVFFSAMTLAIVIFYLVVYFFKVENLVSRLPLLGKLAEVIRLLRKIEKKKLIWCFLLSLAGEILWIGQVWLISLVVGANFSLISAFVFLPVIALALILPISVAGFGAREQMYLLFFRQVGAMDEKILLVSTFIGLLGILNALIGGLWKLLDDSV